MKKMRTLVTLAVFLLAAQTAMAATYYVRSGAAGSKDGSDWTNAYTALPSTLVRGSIYYVAGGSYAGRTFNTAASGSSVITIKGATISDHGTNAGWSDSYSVNVDEGGSQAVWTSGVSFNSSYWVFDGSVGPVWSKNPDQYGFLMSSTRYPFTVYNTSSAISDITIAHAACTAPSGDVEKFFVSTNNSTKSVGNVTISHTYANAFQNTIWATSAGLAMDNWVYEYSVSLNGWGSSANHGEDLNNNYGKLGLTARYNWFEGRQSSGSTGCIVCNNGSCQPYYIYGNVFKNMSGGDGCITGVHYTVSGAVYNNVFINFNTGYNNGQWIGHDVSSTVYNNIIYTGNAAIGSSVTHDYNAYFGTTSTPSESHGYSGSGSPFVNVNGNDLNLISSVASAMAAGVALTAPYNQDAWGSARGGDGKWDRGVLEYGGAQVAYFTVTPSAGTNGSISASSPQTVASGGTIQFSVIANAGYTATVGGSCGGILSGTTFTTNPVTANCTVLATFSPAAGVSRPSPPPTVSIQ